MCRKTIKSIIVGKLSKPFKNCQALGAKDMITMCLTTVILVGILVYYMASIQHESVTNGLNSEANSLVDVISENRKITSAIHSHYCDNVDRYNFYVTDYKIVYKVYEVTSSEIKIKGTPKVVLKGGNFGSDIILNKNDIIRVEIISTNETLLTKATAFVGGTGIADVVGFAEGGVD